MPFTGGDDRFDRNYRNSPIAKLLIFLFTFLLNLPEYI